MGAQRGHDGSQRRLFGHVEILKMLVEGFIPPKILKGLELELDAAEQLNAKFVSEGLSVREADVVWRIPRRADGDAPLYLCILLEFQSSVDPMMSLRVLQYVSFIYEHIARADKLSAGSLPPVLPVVLYNGGPEWSAPVQVRDLIASPRGSGLSPYLPTLRFLLIDEGRISTARLDRSNTILAQLFKLEKLSEPEKLDAQVKHIIAQIKALPQDIKDDVALFISELLKPHKIVVAPHALLKPTENKTMLGDAIALLKKQAAQEGIKEGIKEGLREQLGKLLGLRFGAREGRAAEIEGLSVEQLDHAITLILSADSERALLDAVDAG
jgi:hypothetical protein